jgi:hypothetical protein
MRRMQGADSAEDDEEVEEASESSQDGMGVLRKTRLTLSRGNRNRRLIDRYCK